MLPIAIAIMFTLLLCIANLEDTCRICGDHSNENHEFWVWLSVIHASFIIIACNNYVGAM